MSNNENKTKDGFGSGVALIIVGVLALLVTFFDVDINWHMMLKLWPLLLIIIGVGIMPINKWIRTALVVALITLGIVAYQNKTEGTKVIHKTEIISRFKSDNDD